MPRASRIKSESGIYHIMLREINQQVIFEQLEDYEKFAEVLNKQAISGYKVVVYNHIHLVIKEERENIEQIIKRIAVSYAIAIPIKKTTVKEFTPNKWYIFE